MAVNEVNCPICNADIPLGDECPGEQIYCTYCGAPCLLKSGPDSDPANWVLEEDF